jgi:YVTN family beta-propeller protein
MNTHPGDRNDRRNLKEDSAMSHSSSLNWFKDHVSRTFGVKARSRRAKHARRSRGLGFHQLEDRRMMSALPLSAALPDSPPAASALVASAALAPKASVARGLPSGTPTVSTFVAGTLDYPGGMAFDAAGNLYVANYFRNTISKVTPAGAVSTFVSSGLDAPDGMAFDAAGNLYVANCFNNTISKVTPRGNVSTFVSGLSGTLAFDAAGNLYVANGNSTISKVTPAGTVSTFVGSGLDNPDALAFDAAGSLYVANNDPGWNGQYYSISKVTPAGAVSTFVSNGSGLYQPEGLAFDTAGNLYVANEDSTISKVTPAGAVSNFVSGFYEPEGLAFDAAGNLYVANSGNSTISKVSPAGTISTFVATAPDSPYGLAFDATGNLYVANYVSSTISRVTPAGMVSTFASSGLDYPTGLAFDAAGNLYVANYLNSTISEVTPAGTVSTFVSSGLDYPTGLVCDSAGDLYVTNMGNDTISKVTPAGTVSTFVSGLSGPLAIDAAGNLYVASGQSTISEVTPAGAVSTFVSGGLDYPVALTIDAAGNLYAANVPDDNSICKITPAGTVSTFIPHGAGLSEPEGLAFNAAGSLYVANWESNTISVITTATPPAIVTAAHVAANPVRGTSTLLSVLGTDAAGAANLTYTWTTTSMPSGAPAPSFSADGTNAARNSIVSFGKAGTYTLTATITDPAGLSVASSVTVTVAQTLTKDIVTPGKVWLLRGAKQQFTAAGLDQFGNPLVNAPKFTWFTTAGHITSGGLLTAPATTGNVTVIAIGGSRYGIASVTVSATTFLGLKDPVLASLVQSLDADGSINRDDMIEILRSVDNGRLSATDFADLKTIVADAARLDMPNYVQVLASDVVDGNPANAHYQGQALGNLAAGSPAIVLNDRIGKWFLGTDLPLADAGTNGVPFGYALASGSLFVGSPSHQDEAQGYLGDCYLISSLGSVADASPAAIRNMFLDNGDGTWTVRFYVNGTADYVTVSAMLPVDSAGNLVYADCGSSASSASNVLWIPLAEKAYVEWDETGKEGRGGVNAYSDIEGGWMADVYTQLLGQAAGSYNLVTASDQAALVTAMTNHWAVSIATICPNNSDDSLAYSLYGCHAYAVIGYDSNAGTFTLYNPWGFDQPTNSLTWTQLQSVCFYFSVADPAGTVPISQVRQQGIGSVAAGVLSAVPGARRATVGEQSSSLGPFDGAMASLMNWTNGAADASLPWAQPAGSTRSHYARAVDALFQHLV